MDYTFSVLPTDLVYEIFSYLPISTLARISPTCKKWSTSSWTSLRVLKLHVLQDTLSPTFIKWVLGRVQPQRITAIRVGLVQQAEPTPLLHLLSTCMASIPFLHPVGTNLKSLVLEHSPPGMITDFELVTQFTCLKALSTRFPISGELQKLSNLTELRLVGYNQSEELLKQVLSGLPKLENFTLFTSTKISSDLFPIVFKNVSTLEFRSKNFDGGLEFLKKFPNVSSISLNIFRISQADLEHITNCKKLNQIMTGATWPDDAYYSLRGLDIHSIGMVDIGIFGFQALKQLPNIRSLKCLVGENTDMSFIPKKLTDLNIFVQGGHSVEFDYISDCQNLRSLSVTTAGTLNLSFLHTLSKLETFIVSCMSRVEHQNHLSFLENLMNLTLSCSEFGDAGGVHLAKLTNLTMLDLSGTKITGKTMSGLTSLINLRTLRIRRTGIKAEDITNVLPHLTSLTRLPLGPILNLTDDDVIKFTSLKCLEELDLSENTALTPRILSECLFRLPLLTHVMLNNCPEIPLLLVRKYLGPSVANIVRANREGHAPPDQAKRAGQQD